MQIRHPILPHMNVGLTLQASSTRAPALLECVAAMSASASLAPVLAGLPSLTSPSCTHPADQAAITSPNVSELGHK